jgi:hypothetical protein
MDDPSTANGIRINLEKSRESGKQFPDAGPKAASSAAEGKRLTSWSGNLPSCEEQSVKADSQKL